MLSRWKCLGFYEPRALDGIGLTSAPMPDDHITGRLLEQNGAASVIRTRDLTLTKGALYRWSYGSTDAVFTIECKALQAGLAVRHV